jgi:hypothetical protein
MKNKKYIDKEKKVILNSEVRDPEFDYDRYHEDLKKTVTKHLSIPSLFRKGK